MAESSFFSIEIRDLNFDYDRYYLSLEENPNEFLIFDHSINNNNVDNNLPKDAISDITPYTIVPKFWIDKINTPILFQLFNINYESLRKKEKNDNESLKNDEQKENNIIDINKFDENINNIDNNNIENSKEIILEEDENNIMNITQSKNPSKRELYLQSLNMRELTLHLKSFSSKKIVFSFQIRYPLFSHFYTFLGDSYDKFKILQYPCILLQYESNSIRSTTKISKSSKNKNSSESSSVGDIRDNNNILLSGYYALKKILISKKDEEFFDEEINFAIKTEEDQGAFEQLFTNRKKPMAPKQKNLIILQDILDSKGMYDSTLSTLEEKKEKLKNKKKELTEIILRRQKLLKEKEKIYLYQKKIEANRNNWNRLVTLKEILNKINTYTREVILLKQEKISKSDNLIKKYQREIDEKKNKKIPGLNKINKSLQISNFFLTKYSINELCYFFFNQNINRYQVFPSFYKLTLKELNLNKKAIEDFYNNHSKEISAMFGNLVFLLTYISKKFDIIFPYALYYNGSKSMAFTNMGIKSYGVDLYLKENERYVLNYGNKNENDIFIKTEVIAKMIYDTIMFFYSKKICSNKFKISDIANKKKKNKNNMYLCWIKLNELFKDIIGKN